jgi:hypothetical protein
MNQFRRLRSLIPVKPQILRDLHKALGPHGEAADALTYDEALHFEGVRQIAHAASSFANA